MIENPGSRRSPRHTNLMRAAHGDVTALTVLYAVLFGAIVAGRFGWWGLALYALVVSPLLARYVYRRGITAP